MKYKVTMVIEDHFVPDDVRSVIESLINDETLFTVKTITVEGSKDDEGTKKIDYSA